MHFLQKLHNQNFIKGHFHLDATKNRMMEFKGMNIHIMPPLCIHFFFPHNYTLVKIYQRIYSSHRSLQTGQSRGRNVQLPANSHLILLEAWTHYFLSHGHRVIYACYNPQKGYMCHHATAKIFTLSYSLPVTYACKTRSGCFDTTGIPSSFITPYPTNTGTLLGKWRQKDDQKTMLLSVCLTRLGTVFNLIKGGKIKCCLFTPGGHKEGSSGIAPPILDPGKNPSTLWKGGWMSPTACLDVLEKRKILCPCQESNCK